MLRPLALAIGFLTRIPVPTGAVEPRDLGRAVAYFPIVGALLGAILAATHHAFAGHISSALLAISLATILAGLTGGLHLDGVADVFDALGGGRGNRDRMLAIMRDSRIGAHGATALILVLAAKLAALAEVVDAGRTWALFGAPVAARWAVVLLIAWFPYARPEGLGKAFHGHAGTAQLVGATAACALALCWIGAPTLLPSVAAAAASLLVATWLQRRLGGLTGDVYGAAIELAELAFLLAASLP